MAVDVLVRLRVNDSELEQLEKDVKKLGGSMKKLEETSSKASKETANNFDQAGEAADNLGGGVEGAVRQVRILGVAAKTSGAAFRSALIATGIGAFVVVLGLVVDNWEAISDYVNGVNNDLETQIGLSEELLRDLEHELDLLEVKEKILKLEGESTEEIKKQKKIIIVLQQAENLLLLERLKSQLELQKEQAKELTFWEKLNKAALKFRGINSSDTSAITDEEKARLEEIEEKIQDAELRFEKLQLALLTIDKLPRAKKDKPLQDREDDPTALGEGAGLFQADEAALLERNEIIIGLEQDLSDSILNITEETNRRRNLNEKESAEARERIAEIEFQNKQRLLDAVGGGLAALSDIVGEQTSAGKALAVAGALIDTYAAIAGQLSAFSKVPIPGYAIAQAIATGLAGFAAVKNIIKVKVPNDKGSSQGGFSAPGGGVSAPSFNVVGTSGVNQLADTLQQQDQPLRAFVVGSDVTTQQELDHQINETATIS